MKKSQKAKLLKIVVPMLVVFSLLIVMGISLDRRPEERETETTEMEEVVFIAIEEEVQSVEAVSPTLQKESRREFHDGFSHEEYEQLKKVREDLEEDFLRRIEPEPIVIVSSEKEDQKDNKEKKDPEPVKEKAPAQEEEEKEEIKQEKTAEKTVKEEIPDLSIYLGIYNIKGTSTALSESGWESLQRWRKGILDLADRNRDLIRINGDTSKKLVALTFDDGPEGNVTPGIMRILKDYNVKGNFFFVGRNVQNHPQVVKRAHDEGHMVLSHSFKHSNYNHLSLEDIEKDFRKTNRAIEEITGIYPRFMRPPYGIVNEDVMKASRKYEQKIIIWSADSMDWSQRDKKSITRNVLENVRPGEIILMHSSGSSTATAEALPGIIEGLLAKGYRIVRLDEMFE